MSAGPKNGRQVTHSVWVARQYCGALGKVANCQVAVPAAIWTAVRRYLLGAALYLPEPWLTDAAREPARIPASRALSGEVAPSPDVAAAGPREWDHHHRRGGGCGVWRQRPVSGPVAPAPAPVCRGDLVVADRVCGAAPPRAAAERPAGAPAHPTGPGRGACGPPRWPPWPRRSAGGGASVGATAARADVWTVQCVALRLTPAHAWRERRLAPEVWLGAERDTGQTPQTTYYFVHRPATTALPQLVRFAHQRWAIEQQYRELKTNLGLDHFEGRTFPGWHQHVVLTAITYNFLQASGGGVSPG